MCDLLVPLASKKGLELIILVDDTLPLLLIGDPDRMKQILMNLIGNAIKFSTAGNVVIRYWHAKPVPLGVGASHHYQDKSQGNDRKGFDFSSSSIPVRPVADISGSTGSIYPYSSALGSKIPVSDGSKREFTTQEVLDSMSKKYKSDMAEHPLMVQKLRMEAAAALSSKSTNPISEGPTPGLEPKLTMDSRPNLSMLYHGSTNHQPGEDIVLHCSVQDQGIGMSPEEQKMLFVSFQQTDNGTTRKYGGTGLGLSICSQLINHMRGKITVKSEKDHGSTFTFTAGLRTITEKDRELNPTETARILECETVMETRWQSLRRRNRILILSPNMMLTEQLMRIIPGAEYLAFSSVREAVEAEVISLNGNNCQDKKEELGDQSHKKGLEPFDFILVDHVLDTFELDQLFPTPAVAFVLLLQPTTETLRWILPPAEKNASKRQRRHPTNGEIYPGQHNEKLETIDSEDHHSLLKDEHESGAFQDESWTEGDPADEEMTDDEIDSGQVDVGGRGRLRLDSSGLTSGGSYAMPPGPIATASPQKTALRPSLLFKKRCTSRNSAPTAASEGTLLTMGKRGTRKAAYHVCRMIKPVRRLKLLQIMYNAVVQQEEKNGQRGSLDHSSSAPSTNNNFELDMDLDAAGSSPIPLSSTMTSSNSPIMTRKRSRAGAEGAQTGSLIDGDQGRIESLGTERARKVTRHYQGDMPLSRRRVTHMGMLSSENRDEGFPKRTKNSDSLAMLSAEEREQCRGMNVLVAEDDFVSQKILEKQLSKLGMRVTIANNGQEAVKRWMDAKKGFYAVAIFDHVSIVGRKTAPVLLFLAVVGLIRLL